MAKRSAGILMYRNRHPGPEVLLVHPGGPFWAKKDFGAWSIPKGEYVEGEDALATAAREFEEETGVRPRGDFIPLGELAQPSRKIVTAWAVEGDFDVATLKSNTFELEWPPRRGRRSLVSRSRPCRVAFTARRATKNPYRAEGFFGAAQRDYCCTQAVTAATSRPRQSPLSHMTSSLR